MLCNTNIDEFVYCWISFGGVKSPVYNIFVFLHRDSYIGSAVDSGSSDPSSIPSRDAWALHRGDY